MVPVRARTLDADPEDLPALSEAFPLGLSVGDVSCRTARVVSRYTGQQPLELWLYARQGGRWVQKDLMMVDAPQDAVGVDLTGLSADGYYAYVLVETNGSGAPLSRSPVGRFRTPPPDDTQAPLLITASACARQRFGFQTLDRAAEVDSSVHLLLGDTSYNDGAKDVEGYRAKWMETLSRAEYVRLRGATSMMATWDDHEVENNWWPGGLEAEQINAAKQTFMEHVPVQPNPEGFRLWRSLRWGGTAEFFMLDLYSEQERNHGHFISPAQLDWFKGALRASTAVFKVVLTSLPISRLPFPALLYTPGRWGGFPTQRGEMLKATQDVPGVLWLAGDLHLPAIGRTDLWGPGRHQTEVVVGPAAHDINPLWRTFVRPQWDFTGRFMNVAALDFDPQQHRVTVTYVDGDGRARAQQTYVL